MHAIPKAQTMHAKHIKSDSKSQVQHYGKRDEQFAGQAKYTVQQIESPGIMCLSSGCHQSCYEATAC